MDICFTYTVGDKKMLFNLLLLMKYGSCHLYKIKLQSGLVTNAQSGKDFKYFLQCIL